MQNLITVKVKLVGVLKALLPITSSILEVKLSKGSKIKDLINYLCEMSKQLCNRLYDENRDDLQPDIYIAINDVDIRLLNYLEEELQDGDNVLILTYIHGG